MTTAIAEIASTFCDTMPRASPQTSSAWTVRSTAAASKLDHERARSLNDEREPSAFISYSHADADFAIPFYEGLRRRGIDVWIDKVELLIGDSLSTKIGRAIVDNDFVIAIISPESVKSAWCEKELAIAVTQGINNKKVKVLPVRLDQARMPPSISDAMYLDADRSDPDGAAEQMALAISRHLGLISPDLQKLVATTAPQPGPPSGPPGWSGAPWGITAGPLAVPQAGRDAVGFGYKLERNGQERRVIVWISGSAMASSSGLPPEVSEAKRTRGRSVARQLCQIDDPPAEVMAATYGIRLGVPN